MAFHVQCDYVNNNNAVHIIGKGGIATILDINASYKTDSVM